LLIKICFKYITNFAPQIYFYNEQLFLKKKIFTKNFFIIFLLLEYISKKNNVCSTKIILLPIKNKSISYLRSPNRSKSSQVSIKIKKYRILTIIKFNLIDLSKLSSKITFIIFFFKKNFEKFKFFESNNLLLNNLKIEANYNYNLK
jgi:hypothetical protein